MKTVLIDVREPKEFQDFALPGAINLPLDESNTSAFECYSQDHICLVCEGGTRANKMRVALERDGFTSVSLLNQHMGHLKESQSSSTTWTVDRQFRLALALFLAVFFVGLAFSSQAIWIVPVIVFSGLLYSAITDNCYLKVALSNMPWNRTALN